jgi:hypothetical protein
VGLAGRYCLNDSIAGPCDFRSDEFQKVWYMFDRSRTRFHDQNLQKKRHNIFTAQSQKFLL